MCWPARSRRTFSSRATVPAPGPDLPGYGVRTWQPASAGMQVPYPRYMLERLIQAEDELLSVLSDGELWANGLGRIEWRHILPNLSFRILSNLVLSLPSRSCTQTGPPYLEAWRLYSSDIYPPYRENSAFIIRNLFFFSPEFEPSAICRCSRQRRF